MKKLSAMIAVSANGDAATQSSSSSVFGRTSSDSSTLSLMIPSSYYDNRWMKAAKLLRTDPSLMTGKILIAALKNKAPLSVIKFFLTVNPKAAGIPKEGPTPLQVAVQHNASTEIVKELVEACPFALIVTTSAEWLDPLSYARRHRSSEADLIALLSRPLGSWIHPKEKQDERKEADAVATVTQCPKPPTVPFLKKKEVAPKQNPTAFSAEDKQELQNVKQLCLTVMKGQKRLVREVGLFKDKVERHTTTELDPEGITAGVALYNEPEVTIQDIKEIEYNQQRTLKAHLIALDMKERAMRVYVQGMEHKILQALQVTKQDYIAERSYEDAFRRLRDDLHNAARRMDEFVGSLEHRMTDLEVRLDNETQSNERLRSNGEILGEHEGFEVISVVRNTPLFFATPYREFRKEDADPLWPKEEAQGDGKYPKSCLCRRFQSRRRHPPRSLPHSFS